MSPLFRAFTIPGLVCALQSQTSFLCGAETPTAPTAGQEAENPENKNRAKSSEDAPPQPPSSVLSEEVVKKVRGNTGGFHPYSSSQFRAEFVNKSEYTVTHVVILVRLKDKATERETQHVVELGPPEKIIPPGQTVILFGDVGATRQEKNFSWHVKEMQGYKTTERPVEAEQKPGKSR